MKLKMCVTYLLMLALAAYGMGKEEAYRSISLTPAEIIGMADRYGSLEEGKIANLFICDGDPNGN